MRMTAAVMYEQGLPPPYAASQPFKIEDVDLDDLNPESLWKFRVKGFGPLLVSMDSHGGSLYTEVNEAARAKRAAALASLGVKSPK